MSNSQDWIKDAITKVAVDSFNQGFNADRHPLIYNEFDLESARKAGSASERKKIFDIIAKITCSNNVGEYVYIRDLIEYLEEADA